LINEIPFDFQRRIMSVVLRHQNQSMIYSKGSLEEILAISSTYVENGKIKKITKTVIDKIMASADVYNDCGMRILGVAQKVYKNVSSKQEINKTDEKQMQFLGFVVLFDLPRFSSKQTIQDLITHGIEPKILTGDNIAVTKHLCQTLGLHVKGILSGSEMDRMSNEELKNVLNFVTVFVKLTPIHKERIIQTLREQGHVVGFVGDGTNDALAMHASDFSVALCNATDIAKQNVDFVMKNDDISVIVKAAIAGRVAHVNIMKYIKLALTQSVNWIIITLIASF
jgi:Mg2+-importing ATPase